MNQWHVNEELFQAVFRKDVSAAARILREGSRVNARSIRGYSVIHCAVMNNDLRMDMSLLGTLPTVYYLHPKTGIFNF